jgi:hypothetical protein
MRSGGLSDGVKEMFPGNRDVAACSMAAAMERVARDAGGRSGSTELRETGALEALRLPDQAARLSWLAEQLSRLPGTGVPRHAEQKGVERTHWRRRPLWRVGARPRDGTGVG